MNPFERFDLAIDADLAEITRALRERMDDADTEEERSALRDAWELLSTDAEARLELALDALPRLATPVPAAPRSPAAQEADPIRVLDRVPLPAPPAPLAPLAWTPGAIALDEDPAFHTLSVELPS